jgi:hypothetical protein
MNLKEKSHLLVLLFLTKYRESPVPISPVKNASWAGKMDGEQNCCGIQAVNLKLGFLWIGSLLAATGVDLVLWSMVKSDIPLALPLFNRGVLVQRDLY